MARPTKKGVDYFPFDVGFFGDKNVRILKARYSADGIAVYIKILCDVYKEGYYLPVVDWEDYVFVVADEFGSTTNKVEQIIAFLQSHAMIRIFRKKDELTGLDVDAVITSHGIQKRYATAMKSRRKKSVDEIKRGFWLLTEEEENEINAFYKNEINGSLSEKNTDKSEKNTDKSEKNTDKESPKESPNHINEIDICTDVQGKSERKKETKKCSHIVLPPSAGMRSVEEQEQHERAKKELFHMCPQWVNASKKVDDTPIESYVKLLDAVKKSTFLQGFGSFKWVVEHYPAIIEDAYIDYAKPEPNTNNSASTPPKLPPIIQAINDKADRDRFYQLRQEKVKRIADSKYEKALQKSVNFALAEQDLRKIQKPLAVAELRDATLFKELKEKQTALMRARLYALKDIGMTLEDIEGKPFCLKCSDTGTLQNGKACDCYQKEKEELK